MREVLDRLREAETALDKKLNDVYYQTPLTDQVEIIDLLWKAKQAIWWAFMHALNAAAGVSGDTTLKSRLTSYEGAAAAYKRGVEKGP